MALIPLNDSVNQVQISGDGWDEVRSTPIAHACRIDEGTKLVTNQHGKEVTSNTQIKIEGAIAVSYQDEFTFNDATGNEITRKPQAIKMIKDIGSVVLFTEVSF